MRINGSEVLRREKVIDTVSTLARVRLFKHFETQHDDPDAVEYAARRGILLGLDLACDEGVLSRERPDRIVAEVVLETGLRAEAETVAAFLHRGIQTQHRFGNATGSLSCDTMNGTRPWLGEVIDVTRPKVEVTRMEIFSDGYPDLSEDVSAEARERSFLRAEETAYHKTGRFATVKGSTGTEFFDDRTIPWFSAT